jgi:hypothetical protein
MFTALLPTLLLLAQNPVPPAPAPVVEVQSDPLPAAQAAPAPAGQSAQSVPAPALQPAAKQSANQSPLSFYSQRFPFHWDQFMPLKAEVDGLRINSIFFNKRTMTLFKTAEFGTRAVIEVTNTASAKRVPGFAVAVFDAQNRLLGVASGGPKLGGIQPGDTESFDLNFHQVVERVPRADHFVLAVELTN